MNKVEYVCSKLLADSGVTHGWFTRSGGVSKELFESLNGKMGNGDKKSHVDENRRRALAALVANNDSHSDLAHIAHSFETAILEAVQPGEFAGYDASFTARKDVVLSQATADCGTVIVASTDGGIVSLIHCSWHTLKDEIICKTIAELTRHANSSFAAGIGPMICRACYEFGPEAADLFEAKYLSKYGNKYLVDLKSMIFDQLKLAGISQIDDLNICTKEDERFFSHRRGGSNSGRFITLAGID